MVSLLGLGAREEGEEAESETQARDITVEVMITLCSQAA